MYFCSDIFLYKIIFSFLSLPLYLKATNEPVVPRDTVDPLFRPVNFLVPFTPQQGEITGEIDTYIKPAKHLFSGR